MEPVLPSENTVSAIARIRARFCSNAFQQTSGLVVLFFLCALVYGAIIVWILVLIFFTAPVVSKKVGLVMP